MNRILIDDIIAYRKRKIPCDVDLRGFLNSHKRARFVGSGCYRHVYESDGDDEDYVIKQGESGPNYQDYSHFSSGSILFPNAIAAGKRMDWIAVEKVKQVHDPIVFRESLILAFPVLTELDSLLSRFNTGKKTRVSRFLSAHSKDFCIITSAFMGLIGNNDRFSIGEWSSYNKPTFKTFFYNVIGHNPELFKQYSRIMEIYKYNDFRPFVDAVEENDVIVSEFFKAYKYLIQSESITSFLKLIDDFKPDTQEMFPANWGFIPTDKRLVLIDSQK